MFLLHRRAALLIVPMFLAVAQAPAWGGLILSAGPLTLTPGAGSTGTITISVASSDGTDVLDAFGVEFRLTSSTGHYLSFVSPPADAQLGDPAYLFHDDSVSELVGPPSGSVSTVDNPDDTYIGGDGTLSGLGVAVPTQDAAKILLVLQVTVPEDSGVQDGDVFQLSLIRGPSTFFLGPIPSDGEPPSLDVRFDGASIRISAVPEPSSLVTAAIGLTLGLGGIAFRRRFRPLATPKP
ncbi:MAG: hypothetical protein U0790_10855 [Isosphaeraceae bacterium]